jgi:hypothetical protein
VKKVRFHSALHGDEPLRQERAGGTAIRTPAIDIVSPKAPAFQTLVILWGSLLTSHFIFVFVLTTLPAAESGVPPTLPYLLAAAGLPVAASSIFVPRLLFRNAVRLAKIPLIETPDPAGLPGFGKTIQVAENREAAVRAVTPAYSTRVILGCALAEAVSLFGFVLKFTGFSWSMAAPFFVVGIALAASHFPSRASMIREAEGALGVRLEAS